MSKLGSRTHRLEALLERVAAESNSELELRVTLDRALEEAAPTSWLASRAHEEYGALWVSKSWSDGAPDAQALWLGLRHLRVVLQNGHENDRVHALMAMAWGGLGHLRLACQSYRRAIQMNPHVAEYHHNLGVMLRDGLGKSIEAEPHLNYSKKLLEGHRTHRPLAL